MELFQRKKELKESTREMNKEHKGTRESKNKSDNKLKDKKVETTEPTKLKGRIKTRPHPCCLWSTTNERDIFFKLSCPSHVKKA